MADVFKARIQGPAGFERTFVVKRILPHLSDDPSFTKMFIDEAKIAAKLAHPNIVQVFELGSVDDEYFMSMEYVRGHDLAETMRTLWARVGPPRPELVAYVGREMCRALAYAHDFTSEDGQSLGMIHRDVSPSNVMLSYDGAVKILDFGIAKALGGDAVEETKSGTLKGKFAYMAPEQTVSNEIDRRIDIFATGIVLHEILTGRRLFKGENDMQTIERVRTCQVAAPSLFNPLCPPQLDQIVLQALARNRDERYQSASEMADALDDVVYASRFQATHLAQTMRSLFPAEVGGDGRMGVTGRIPSQLMTGSVSPSRSSTGVSRSGAHASRPNPTGTRSPTVPPVVPPPPITSASYRLPPSRSNISASPTTAVGFLMRPLIGSVPGWVAVAALLLLGFAFVGGAIWTLRGPSGGGMAAHNSIPKIVLLDLAFQSSPIGADVYIVGSNEYLGRTPFRRKVEYRDDRTTFVVFRLAGHLEMTKEVRPDFAGAVTLQELAPPVAPAPMPAPPPPPVAMPPVPPAHPPAGAHKADSFEKARPTKPHGKGRAKGGGTRDVDPFDISLPGGHKASPFN
jgi:serine/threonine protein kinase